MTMRDEWRIRGGFGVETVLRRWDATDEEKGRAEHPTFAAQSVSGWLSDHVHRPVALRIHESVAGADAWSGSGGGYTRYDFDSVVRSRLERAFRDRELILLRPPIVWAPLAEDPPDTVQALGPLDEPAAPDTWIAVEVYDSTGEPLAGEPCLIVPPDGSDPAPLSAMGARRIPRLEPASQTMCMMSFPKITTRRGTVPAEAERKPLDGASQVARVELFNAFGAMTNEKHVFQLKRRQAHVIELEHFDTGGAVMLPGSSPAPMRENAVRVSGIDALKACLAQAQYCPMERILIIGHDSKLSKERATSVLHLLTADRAAWVAVSASTGREMDCRFILAWIRQTTTWACEPGNEMAPAVFEFQRRFKAEIDPSIDVDGIVGPPLWGAFFDMYMRAIRSPPAKTEHAHPYIRVVFGKNFVPHVVAGDATGDDARYVEMNPYNPTKPIPGNAGWHDTMPGEIVTLPDDWDGYVEKLRAAGWEANHGDVVAPFTPSFEKLPKPGPKILGCVGKYRTSPQASAKRRRARERNVEVIFLDAQIDIDQTDAWPIYDPREFHLSYLRVDRVLRDGGRPNALGCYDLLFHRRLTASDPLERYRLVADDGSYDQTMCRRDAQPEGKHLRLRFADVPTQPSYDLFQILTTGVEMAILTDTAVDD